jgi:hypothetical protein
MVSHPRAREHGRTRFAWPEREVPSLLSYFSAACGGKRENGKALAYCFSPIDFMVGGM